MKLLIRPPCHATNVKPVPAIRMIQDYSNGV